MTILAMPTAPGFSYARFALKSNTKLGSSQLDGTVQTLEFPGAVWTFTASIARTNDRAQAAAWQAFFTQLRGMANRFYAYDPFARTPRGTALGTPLVNGGSQTGNTLITDGWTPSQSGLLLPGDYFQVGTELKMITATAASDGAGNATLTFEPPIRNSPANNAPIITTNPVCVMRKIDNNPDGWDMEPGGFYTMALSGVESFV